MRKLNFNSRRMYIEIIALVGVALFTTLLLERMFQNPFDMKEILLLMNFLVQLAILGVCVSIGKKFSRGVRLHAFLVWAFGTINFSVLSFRSTPFVPWDIYSFTTAMSVAGGYEFTFEKGYVIATLGFILIFIGSRFFQSVIPTVKNRLVSVAIFLVFALALFFGIRDEDFSYSLGIDTTLISTKHMSIKNGYLVNFLYCTRYLDIDAPAKYSVNTVNDCIRNYAGDVYANTGIGLAKGEKPDIVVVMNESFSDLRDVADFRTNLPYLDYFYSLQENVQRGDLFSSVIGGNTATAEFEFLTGMSMAFLPLNSVAYVQYIHNPLPTLASHIKAQGYDTLAMHPFYATGWNRQTLYPGFGFDRLAFINEFTHDEKIRDYISDESLFKEIQMELDDAEKKEKGPQFIFSISMQNHGGYTDVYENFNPEVEITSQETNVEVQQYLSLVRETDTQLEAFISYLKQRKRPTLLLFFGDHQPNNYTVSPLVEGMSESEKEVKRRITKYLFWANYEIEENEATSSINYLGNHLLQAANLPLNPWHQFLRVVEEEYPILYDIHYRDKEGNVENIRDRALPSLLEEYEILQYDYLFSNSEKNSMHP